ncbi:YceI family protein [Parapedobacter koreensis]|uniref:Polyisoprenoid-binding protein YceI n=1 Tax=Parapedobacter koreensis TaxID=332977 RepID=A0A1H7TJQ7_9SPHI|nr:YceI family protein [Parapedobacter koreensis]SEL85080.1 Polyisoprenoid-binding protein YceI [Parapedobacter koreensis]
MKKKFIGALVAFLALSACKEADNPAVVTYEINTETSYVEWRGYLPEGNNHGRISIDDDEVTTENNQVTGGSFSIPLSSINVLNLEGELKEQLEHHLQSADFFNAVLYPNITFQIREVAPYHGDGGEHVVDGANYEVTGDLTFLGKANIITFPANVDFSGNQLHAEALITIDRLEWGMDYASDPEAPQYILPGIDLHLVLVANQQ